MKEEPGGPGSVLGIAAESQGDNDGSGELTVMHQ